MNKYNCAKKIWDKLDTKEQKLWNKYYKLILSEIKTGLKCKYTNDVMAHNFSCFVVWEFINGLELGFSKRK